MSEHVSKVRVAWFPRYSEVHQLLKVLEGVSRASVRNMLRSIWEQTGTPQSPVDWSDPDTWIVQRLSAEDSRLAKRIWEESDRTANPRHIHDACIFIDSYQLLSPDGAGVYQLTELGGDFLNNDDRTIWQIDGTEGLGELLAILTTKTFAKRGDILPEWGDFIREHSNYGTDSSIKYTLRSRLLNLIERELVSREGNMYTITAKGISYGATFKRISDDPRREVTRAIDTYSQNQRDLLRERLTTMSPYRFEHLVRELLEAMGYEDVTVTKESGDRGVDVLASVQFGITTITEVVQVKRHQGNISRPTLDQLRGALPYHEAIRGTLITLGGFSKGCTEAAIYPGAAPITLIDGDILLNLLIEHGIGVKKREVELYDLDEEFFKDSRENSQIVDLPEDVELLSTESAVGEVNYWLTPVRPDEEQTSEDIIRKLVEQEQIYAITEKTPGRKYMKPGDWICFYATAKGVVAHAEVASRPEEMIHPKVRNPERYCWVFRLDAPQLYLDSPIVIDLDLRTQLDGFRGRDLSKRWAWYVQTTRKITEHDFGILTRQDS
jgi:restriction system protein